jgi:hypothetical protein
MIGPHARFEEVRDLPESTLRDLLASGEPVDRIWAAWALGLRLGARSASTLQKAASGDPSAGMRRHLIVLLAGFGERDPIAVIARADPDAHVRATATQYLAALAAVAPSSWSLVLERLDDVEPVVRETLILHLRQDAPAEVREAALRRISDPALPVREAVHARLDALYGAEGPLPAVVRDWALREPTMDLRRSLFAAWRAREGGASLIAAAAQTGREDLALEALDRAVTDEGFLPWATVAVLASAGTRKVRERIFSLFEDRFDEAPLGWLLEHLAGDPWRLLTAVQLLPRLRATHSLDASEQTAVATIAQAAMQDLAIPIDSLDVDERDDWEQWRRQLEAFIREARRLCGSNLSGQT